MLEKKTFQPKPPNFMKQKNFLMKPEIAPAFTAPAKETSVLSRDSNERSQESLVNHDEPTEDNISTSGFKSNTRTPSLFQNSFSPARFTLGARAWSPSPKVNKGLLFTPQKKKTETSLMETISASKSVENSPFYERLKKTRSGSTFPFNVDGFSPSNKSETRNLFSTNRTRKDFSDNLDVVEVDTSDARNFSNEEDESLTGEQHDIDDRLVNCFNQKDRSSCEDKVTFPVSKKIHNLTDEIRDVVDQAQYKMFNENFSLRKRLNVLEQQMLDLESQCTKLTTAQSEAVHRANRTTSENERMREQLNSLQERKNTLEYQLQEKEFALSELHIQLDEKTCCLQTTFDKAKSLEALLQTSNEKISSLEEKIEALLAERDSAVKETATLTEQSRSLDQETASLRMQLQTIESEFQSTISDCKHQLENEKETLKTTQQCLIDAEANLKSVTEDFLACKDKFSKMENSFQRAIEEKLTLEKNVCTLREQLFECEKSKTAAIENISSLESSSGCLRIELQEAKKELESVLQELQITQKNNSLLEEENMSLQNSIEILRAQKAETEQNLELDLSNTKKLLDCERAALIDTKSQWDISQTKLKDALKRNSVELSQFQSAERAWNEERNLLENQIKELQNRLVVNERNLKLTHQENLSLERQLEMSKLEISTFRGDLQTLSASNDDLQSVLDNQRMKSALSEEQLKADLNKRIKEFETLQETQKETLRQLNETRDQLSLSMDACSRAVSSENKLKIDLNNLMDAKLKCEESIKLLFEKIDAQEQKSKKLKEENKALNDTLSAYEDHIIFVQQKFRLVLNENCEGTLLVNELSADVKKLQIGVEKCCKTVEMAEEDVKDFHFSVQNLAKEKQLKTIHTQTSSEQSKPANSSVPIVDAGYFAKSIDKDCSTQINSFLDVTLSDPSSSLVTQPEGYDILQMQQRKLLVGKQSEVKVSKTLIEKPIEKANVNAFDRSKEKSNVFANNLPKRSTTPKSSRMNYSTDDVIIEDESSPPIVRSIPTVRKTYARKRPANPSSPFSTSAGKRSRKPPTKLMN